MENKDHSSSQNAQKHSQASEFSTNSSSITPPQHEENRTSFFSFRKKIFFTLSAGIVLIFFIIWYEAFFPYVSTDDARVAGVFVRIAPEGISGKVIKLNVQEGSLVKTGDVLFELDHSRLESELESAKAKALLATTELKRISALAAQRGIALKDLDIATADAKVANAGLHIAEINYERSFIKSPIDGYVVQKVTEEGNILEPNQVALTIVEKGNLWISANIEETEISHVKLDQDVYINLDSGGHLNGKVSEIRRATASQFALIQAENPSGNFTKIIQRIPIKIKLESEAAPLYVGQSVEIKIHVR